MNNVLLDTYSTIREEQKKVYKSLHSAIDSADYETAEIFSDEYFRLENKLNEIENDLLAMVSIKHGDALRMELRMIN